ARHQRLEVGAVRLGELKPEVDDGEPPEIDQAVLAGAERRAIIPITVPLRNTRGQRSADREHADAAAVSPHGWTIAHPAWCEKRRAACFIVAARWRATP